MNVVVCVKQVPDTQTPIKVDYDRGRINTHEVAYITNPCDLAAVKWAANQKEKDISGEVTVVSLGIPLAEKALRECFAYGADRAFLLHDSSFKDSDSYVTGVILAKAIKILQYDIVLCGVQAADTNAGWTGSVVASRLGIPLVSRIINIQVHHVRPHCRVTHGLDPSVHVSR